MLPREIARDQTRHWPGHATTRDLRPDKTLTRSSYHERSPTRQDTDQVTLPREISDQTRHWPGRATTRDSQRPDKRLTWSRYHERSPTRQDTDQVVLPREIARDQTRHWPGRTTTIDIRPDKTLTRYTTTRDLRPDKTLTRSCYHERSPTRQDTHQVALPREISDQTRHWPGRATTIDLRPDKTLTRSRYNER